MGSTLDPNEIVHQLQFYWNQVGPLNLHVQLNWIQNIDGLVGIISFGCLLYSTSFKDLNVGNQLIQKNVYNKII